MTWRTFRRKYKEGKIDAKSDIYYFFREKWDVSLGVHSAEYLYNSCWNIAYVFDDRRKAALFSLGRIIKVGYNNRKLIEIIEVLHTILNKS